MKNIYKVNGDGTVTIFLRRLRDGHVDEALIDENDLPLLASSKTTWHTKIWPDNRFYIYGQVNGKSMSLHRFLLNPPDDMVIDHRDGNGLNCTRGNMRVVTNAENLQNHIRPRKGHKTSQYRNVHYVPKTGKWKVEVKGVYGGSYATEDEANLVAISMRKQLFTHSVE